jgi:hypothetical protein
MKHNNLVIAGLTLAIGLSGLSLALQVKTSSKFEKYEKTSPSDLEFRWLQADVGSLRERMPAGSMVPFVLGFTPDHKKLVMRVIVLSTELPKSIDERRSAFMSSAMSALMGFDRAFGDDHDLKNERDVVVEFLDMMPVAKNNKAEVIATFENGELTFH